MIDFSSENYSFSTGNRTPGTSREIDSEDAEEEARTGNPGLQTQSSTHWAIQLKSYCWDGVDFIQLVYCVIIYVSFLNCDSLLIQEIQWFYWKQKLLVLVEKFTVKMRNVRLELETPGLQTQCSSHWAIQLKSYCLEGVEFIQLVYCIIIYLFFSELWLTSDSKTTVVLLDTDTTGTSKEIYSENAESEDRTRNPWITNSEF